MESGWAWGVRGKRRESQGGWGNSRVGPGLGGLGGGRSRVGTGWAWGLPGGQWAEEGERGGGISYSKRALDSQGAGLLDLFFAFSD